MKDFKVLKFLDKFKDFFEKIGVDYYLMRKILQLKFIMDGRRVPTAISGSSKKKKENKDENNFIKSLWVYGLIGIIMVPITCFGKNFIFQMSFVFGILMFMIMTSLISDFSSVLLDIRDRNIIGSKPINSKTLSMAKTIHVLVYMFFITIAICGPALIASLVSQGILFFIIFLFEIILMDLFIVVLTALLYLLILKFFDGEKLKDIINYIQIILSISIAIGYQLIGRLFSFVNLSMVFTPKWWQYFIIPMWFGAPFEMVLHRNYNIHFIVFSVLAIVVPVLSIIIYIKLIPAFERNLQKLNDNSGKVKGENKKLLNLVSKIVCFNKEERTFFRFASDMMKNEREFKLKVYPSLGFSLIFPFIFMLNDLKGKGWAEIASSKMYLNIYFCALLLPTAVMMIKYSGKYKGAWIYKIIPNKNVCNIFKGTLKAFIVRLLLPVYLIESVIFMFIFGVKIFPDLILVFLNIMLFTVLCFRITKKSLPFSEEFGVSQGSEGLMAIPLMIILGFLAFIHYKYTFVHYGVYVYIGIMLIVNIILWKKSFNISLEKLNN
ncbi:hypothetical protein HBE96_13555 [Clostridium sp. P21]|uniref:Uncharacterized protein n=1 Tax=Clostridium muellerianum TaxID=2716538 RepID=A0A7Y0EHP6_9CLOT|nr:hypothetical protein [Clostridium muellerianum]NMM63680.1 hypothetical protein [Clostridium muellerianum]